MKSHFFVALSLVLNCATLNAQSLFDSTGGNRLYAPNTPPITNFPGSVDVPGYGTVAQGSIVGSFKRAIEGGCFPVHEYGICTVRNGAGGYSAPDAELGWKQYCPWNSSVIVTAIIRTTNGSVCGGN